MKTLRCQRCNEILNPDHVVWLELSNTDGKYYKKIPNDHVSQGAFSFGRKCSIEELKTKNNE